jgi:tRNA U34 5-carboxymethylaminomethyl modifying GTPase MnmE/TrmE
MKIDYQSEIDKIRNSLKNYYNKQFKSEEEEYIENKKVKEQIKKLIIQVYNDSNLSEADRGYTIKVGVELLAKNTGCAEDAEIAEDILDCLFDDMKILCQEDVDNFYEQYSCRRWY